MFYLSLYILFFTVAVCNFYSFRKSEIALSNVFYYSSIFLLFLVGAFRFETGGDWPGYKQMYDAQSGEPLFLGIIYLAHLIGHYQYIFFFSELIRYAILIYIVNTLYKKEPQYKMLFILLYYSMFFFYYDMVIVRQTTSAIIFAYGVFKNRNGTLKTYFSWSILAGLVHYSGLMLFFMYYPLYKVNNKKFTVFNYIIIALYFAGIDLFGSLLSFVLDFFPKIGIIYKLWAYTQNADLATVRKITGQSLVYLLSFFAISYVHVFKKREMNTTVYNGVCLFIFFYLGLPAFSTISTRLASFFSIFILCAIVEVIRFYHRSLIVTGLFVALAFCFNKNIFLEKSAGIAYNPYQFYFVHELLGRQSTGAERLHIIENQTIKERLSK